MQHVIEFSRQFSAAHRLWPYDGKCSGLHGHNYRVGVVIRSDVLHHEMVVDWEVVKRVIDQFDHKTLLHKDDPLVAHLTQYDGIGVPADMVVPLPVAPTTERLAKYLADLILHRLRKLELELGQVSVGVVLQETPSIVARAQATSMVSAGWRTRGGRLPSSGRRAGTGYGRPRDE